MKLPYKNYERGRPKHEPTDSYFYLEIQISKYMMITDALNSHVYPVRTEITGNRHILILLVCSTDDIESEDFLVDKILLQVCSTDKGESKIIIVDESST